METVMDTTQESPRQRRNRKVNTCDECRVLKRKCNRARPCSNCQKTGRHCVFSAALSSLGVPPPGPVAGPSAHLTAPRGSGPAPSRPAVVPAAPTSLPHDRRQTRQPHSHTPPDICLRIGRLTITDRVEGLPRAGLVGELDALLHRLGFGFPGAEPVDCFAAPIASWFKPHTQAPFLRLLNAPAWPESGDPLQPAGTFALSSAQESSLFDRYFLSVYPVCPLVLPGDLGPVPSEARCAGDGHGSSGMGDDGLRDDDPVAVALRAAVSYAAAVSMPPLETQRVFGLPKPSLVRWLQTATEDAISSSNGFAASLDLRSFQAILIYLTPQMLSEVSRTHAVLVSAVTRQFQLAGLDRGLDGGARDNPGGQGPAEEPGGRRLTRLHCWQHLLFLNIRATEAVGPERSLFEDPEAAMPWPDPGARGRDMVALVRYECYQIHRFVVRQRQNVLRGTLTLRGCLDMLDERVRRVRSNLIDGLEDDVPIQKYARLVGNLLLARSRCMLLHNVNAKLLEWARSPQTRKLRDILIQHSLEVIETGVTLETDPELAHWSWYAGAYHQYHSLLFPLVQVCVDPDHPLADRVMAVADHVFGPSSPSGRPQQRAVAILRAVKQNLESFLAAIEAPPQEPLQPLYFSPLPIRQAPQHADATPFPSQNQHLLPHLTSPEYLAEPIPGIQGPGLGLDHQHHQHHHHHLASPSPPVMGGGGRPAFKDVDSFGQRFLGDIDHGSSTDSHVTAGDTAGVGGGEEHVAGLSVDDVAEAGEGYGWWPWPPQEWWP
ncbi:hypothetical protein GGTG_05957 [Gaeumannomyces tritici R3-111a-1]|uniref:Zn(2)-C6 fungal-type domain-containing protein n=1 Tax=Gaeumannomyces tritici (strain R3-111a-1) TaxID=644352 RepID=J3NXF1_GAET3|nr:hypothetical protein GGTG_05957 [Gaeumannomyces tritici R3-111a-1]EJT76033.1 hypothetical protein GGTG_05957 [Gaeumannomyces tritici R3-111a-1]